MIHCEHPSTDAETESYKTKIQCSNETVCLLLMDRSWSEKNRMQHSINQRLRNFEVALREPFANSNE